MNIKLVEQYSGWDPQKMIDQFKEAVAAKPDGIVIMGHPGGDAFAALVDDAESQGIIITSGNNPRAAFKAIATEIPDQGLWVCRRQPARRWLPDRHGDDRGRTEIRRRSRRLRHLAQ